MYIQNIIEIMESNKSIYELLKHCPYEILRQWELSCFPADQVVFRQGDVQNHFYLIVEGIADINIMAENGKKYSQAIYQAGDMIGELEIFEQRPFVCNVEAQTDVKLIGLRRDYFFQWLELDRHFHLFITRKLSNLFYQLSQKAGDDNLYSLYHRVCRYMLQCIKQGVKNRQGTEIHVDKHLLSQLFAVTPRSINRILQDLKEKEIIEIASQTLIIRDVSRLQEEERISRLD